MDEDDTGPLIDKLRQLMRERGWTAEDVARNATSRLSPATVRKWINVQAKPTPTKAKAAFSGFGEDGTEALRDLSYKGWADDISETRYDENLARVVADLARKVHLLFEDRENKGSSEE